MRVESEEVVSKLKVARGGWVVGGMSCGVGREGGGENQ